jgi:hypothetical protein
MILVRADVGLSRSCARHLIGTRDEPTELLSDPFTVSGVI